MNSRKIKLFTALLAVFGAAGLYGANFQPLMKLEYEYSRSGKITARIINGVRQSYRYDKRGQLLGVYDKNGLAVEEYVYDPAGNILKKTLNGKTTTYTYDKANQLVSSVCDGKVTKYEYDAAGRLVKEGDKTYSYIGLDKIESVTEGGRKLSSFTYHIDGQLAARFGMDSREDFTWDGLALIQRNNVNYVNEPAVTGGNPILADDSVLFNDMLGTTLGVKDGDQFASISRDAFGMTENTSSENFFTGKPHVGEMGYVFLFRNYRADQGKWQTSDPLGYPDGWNNLAYLKNKPNLSVDFLGLFYVEIFGLKSCSAPEFQAAVITYMGHTTENPTYYAYSISLSWSALLTTNWFGMSILCQCGCTEFCPHSIDPEVIDSDLISMYQKYYFFEVQLTQDEFEDYAASWLQEAKKKCC